MLAQKHTVHELVVFVLLVGIAVAGRWGEPVWCFTPVAAVAVFAGYYFANWRVALLVPLASLAISDLWLPAYNNFPVFMSTYAILTLPVFFGRALSRGAAQRKRIALGLVCGLVPATLFFLVTNFAVWAFQSDYQQSWSGLMECYIAAIPFYRWMLAGDIFYLVILFGTFALVTSREHRSADSAFLRVREIREREVEKQI
jgi:hypothetical protein